MDPVPSRLPHISIIIVTSPVQSNPDTTVLDRVVASFEEVEGLATCPVLIILDGYLLSETAKPKSGRITASMATSYEDFHHVLLCKYNSNPEYRILKSDRHRGFAMSVKWGLEECKTEFAVIVQHDRAFCQSFSGLYDLLDVFRQHPHLRYVGFPTSCSVNHEKVLVQKYRLYSLAEEGSYIPLERNMALKPLIFWYDSTHLCHVERYLRIYQPFRNIPDTLKQLFGGEKAVKSMVLRDGDFIEDRFGQAQRHILSSQKDPDSLMRAFRWFGSYLYMHLEEPHDYIMVRHLRGRTFCPVAEKLTSEYKRSDGVNTEHVDRKKPGGVPVPGEILYEEALDIPLSELLEI